MGNFSLWHWIVVIVIAAIYFIPTIKILNKAGYTGWWSVLSLIPLVNIIMLWVFAFADWPSLQGSERR
jgi:hypothetical protein